MVDIHENQTRTIAVWASTILEQFPPAPFRSTIIGGDEKMKREKEEQSQKRYMVISFLDVSYLVSFEVRGQRGSQSLRAG